MSDQLKAARPVYGTQIAETVMEGGAVRFTDDMEKFIDQLIDDVTKESSGDLAICMGDRISGDGEIVFGSRV